MLAAELPSGYNNYYPDNGQAKLWRCLGMAQDAKHEAFLKPRQEQGTREREKHAP